MKNETEVDFPLPFFVVRMHKKRGETLTLKSSKALDFLEFFCYIEGK